MKTAEAVINSETPSITETSRTSKRDGLYAKYVLFVLIIVSALNFMDRSILGILAEDIKADLQLTDAQLGFLAGAAFAVFYALFGMPLGRLADVWSRKKLISVGLSFWSLMTALSGLSRGFVSLGACRFAIGIGEASASPAAWSMLYDYFSPKTRSRVLAFYFIGASIGGGLGIYLGGQILDFWKSTWPDPSLAPFGLKGWQAAFMIVGLPGLLAALWVSSLREPARGASEGLASADHKAPIKEAATTFLGMIPICNLWVLSASGADKKALMLNIIAGMAITLIVSALIFVTGDILQWLAFGIGGYAAYSWAQVLAARDPIVFGMLFKSKALLFTIAAVAATTFKSAAAFWHIPFLQRYHGASSVDVGNILGTGMAVLGIAGMLLGGLLADKLRAHTGRGKLYVVLGSVILSTLASLVMLTTSHLTIAYAAISCPFYAGLPSLHLPLPPSMI